MQTQGACAVPGLQSRVLPERDPHVGGTVEGLLRGKRGPPHCVSHCGLPRKGKHLRGGPSAEHLNQRPNSLSPKKPAVIETCHGSLLDLGQLTVGILCPPCRDLHCAKRFFGMAADWCVSRRFVLHIAGKWPHTGSAARCRGLCVGTTSDWQTRGATRISLAGGKEWCHALSYSCVRC